MTETVHTAATAATAALAAPRIAYAGTSDASTLTDRLSTYQTAVAEDRTIVWAQIPGSYYAPYDTVADFAAAVAARLAITGRTATDLPEHWIITPDGVITIAYKNGDVEEARERIYAGITRDAIARTI